MCSPNGLMLFIILYCCSETLEEDLFYFTPFKLVHGVFIDLKLKTLWQSELAFTFIMFHI